jgi:hypothetical protein
VFFRIDRRAEKQAVAEAGGLAAFSQTRNETGQRWGQRTDRPNACFWHFPEVD